MKIPELSIVIPVYNVASYLDKCVRSCYEQDIPKDAYEIILVNDGSTDNSLEICESLKKEFQSLIIISQENKGLSGARNTGLSAAKGEYVWFVDSDDWIEKNTLAEIINVLKSKVDLAWLGHDTWSGGKTEKEFVPLEINQPVSGTDFFTNHLNNLFYIWKFIYRRDFLIENDLNFLEGILYEDLEFTPRALLKAQTCLTIPKVIYHYLIREGSIATNIKPKNIEHRFFILNELDKLFTSNIEDEFKAGLANVIYNMIDSSLKLAARANIKLPKNSLTTIKVFKGNKYFEGEKNLKYSLITGMPLGYYHFFKSYHALRKVISKS
ncbi:glycosyltransferase [Seonamhaeicola sp. ML3]|uniref:glycosyltransferase n=1 Tax=Seonamhaeicola sp. ML3 TaxID=2937786 RepID=UPI00200F9999|nr:glycosyltransferase [Seonamhaeicola sp. ML3]